MQAHQRAALAVGVREAAGATRFDVGQGVDGGHSEDLDLVRGDCLRAGSQASADKLAQYGATQDFSFVMKQRGMFSYTGLTAAQVERMKDEFGIYAVSTGRICLAALNTKNIDYVADAIVKVM